jgi:hypothetical protein
MGDKITHRQKSGTSRHAHPRSHRGMGYGMSPEELSQGYRPSKRQRRLNKKIDWRDDGLDS